jgi:phosphoserine phosphatase
MSGVKTLYLVDYEGPIVPIYPKENPILKNMKSVYSMSRVGYDIADSLPIEQNLFLKIVVAPPLKSVMSFGKLDKDKSEGIILESFEKVLKTVKPPYKILEKEKKRQKDFISKYAVKFLREFNKKENEKCCVLTTGVFEEVVDFGLRNYGIREVDVYANKPEIRRGKIISYKKPLFSDVKGKENRIKELIEEFEPNYTIAIGDSYADIGMAKFADSTFTYKDADPIFVEYVRKKFGEENILDSSRELFKKLEI